MVDCHPDKCSECRGTLQIQLQLAKLSSAKCNACCPKVVALDAIHFQIRWCWRHGENRARPSNFHCLIRTSIDRTCCDLIWQFETGMQHSLASSSSQDLKCLQSSCNSDFFWPNCMPTSSRLKADPVVQAMEELVPDMDASVLEPPCTVSKRIAGGELTLQLKTRRRWHTFLQGRDAVLAHATKHQLASSKVYYCIRSACATLSQI